MRKQTYRANEIAYDCRVDEIPAELARKYVQAALENVMKNKTPNTENEETLIAGTLMSKFKRHELLAL